MLKTSLWIPSWMMPYVMVTRMIGFVFIYLALCKNFKESQILSSFYWTVTLITLFLGIQNSGLTLIIGLRIHRSQLMRNLLNPPQQYCKRRTRGEDIEKCLDEGLEPTYYSRIFRSVYREARKGKFVFGKTTMVCWTNKCKGCKRPIRTTSCR